MKWHTASVGAATCLSMALTVLPHTPVLAQDAQSAAADGAMVLEPVTVTARKRGEDEQDVPGSLTVIDGFDIPTSTLNPGADIARETPNFNFVDYAQPGSAFGTMRGIGPLGSPLNSLDSTIGFSTNGVPTTSMGFSPTLLDVERVEVLRGPQGTLFGRNALGGSVNVVTTPADGTREYRVTGELGTDGYRLGEALAAGWLVPDVLAGRAVVRYQDFDGDIHNTVTDKDEGGAELTAGRGTLHLTPGFDLDATLAVAFSREERTDPVYMLRDGPGYPKTAADITPEGNRDSLDTTLEISKRFDSFTVTSVTGVQFIELDSQTDYTDAYLYNQYLGQPFESYNDPSIDYGYTDESERIISQEFRLNAPEENAIDWVLGVSYFRSDYDQHRDQQSNLLSNLNGTYDTEIESQTFAAFGDVSVPMPFLEGLTVSGGVRVAHDTQDIHSTYISNGFPGNVPRFSQDQDFTDTYLTGRMAVSYDWTPEVMTYASIAHGYSSGGFNRLTVNAPAGQPDEPFQPATVWTYEAGVHTNLLDQRLKLNASVFYNEVSDGQLSTFDPASLVFYFENQDYASYGFEVEARALLAPGLEVNGGLGFTHSELKNVAEGSMTGAEDGGRVPNVPRFTGNVGILYSLPADVVELPGDFFSSATYQFVGDREADVANSFALDPYHIVDLQLGWETDRVRLYGFVRNALDERPEFFGLQYTADARTTMVGRGRMMGLGVSVFW